MRRPLPSRFLHVSDLHTGTSEDAAVERALLGLIERLDPQLIVASGDLTHRGTCAQHERAANFLRRLGRDVVAIPGNHDIPYTVPARFTTTWREFERQWGTTEPVHSSAELHIVGLNTVRPWRHQSGGLKDRQIDWAVERLEEAPEGALRVVAMHHQMVNAPWRTKKKPVARRTHVLTRLVDSGAELILGGHVHQASVATRHEFEVISGDVRAVTVSIAPGLGQPRPSRRGEARGLHVYETTKSSIGVHTYIWRETDWALTAVRRFPRGREPLVVEPSA